MAKALPMVKKTILKLVESRSEIPRWVLVSFMIILYFCTNFLQLFVLLFFTFLPTKVKFNDHGNNPPHAEVVRDVKTVKELRSGLDELHYGGGGDIDEQAFEGETSSTYLIFVIFSPRI